MIKMIEEKQTVRKHSRLIWVFICIYFLIVAGFYLGKSVGERHGLEYRFWVDACFRIWVWFLPIIVVGVMLLKAFIKQWKRKSAWKWILSVLLVGYSGVAVYASFLYILVSAFTITSDEVAVCFLTNPKDNTSIAPEPFGHSYRVEEVVYGDLRYSFMYTPDTAPRFQFTSDYGMLVSGDILDNVEGEEWVQQFADFEEVKLSPLIFDDYCTGDIKSVWDRS